MRKDRFKKAERGIDRPYLIPFYIPGEGCPSKCIYCNSLTSSYGHQFTIDSKSFNHRVKKFLETRAGRGSRVEVAFYGGSFECLSIERRTYLLSLLRPFLNEGSVDSLRVSLRPHAYSATFLEDMKQSNLSSVELGVQSMHDSTLKKIGRGYDKSVVLKAFDLLRSHGIIISAHIMLGLPGENEEMFKDSLQRLLEIKPDLLRIHPVIVLPGTGLEEMYRKGEYEPLDMDEAIRICSEAYLRSNSSGVRVVRIGLQTNELLGQTVLAGPHHPSFGEMVHSRIAFDRIRQQIDGIKEKSNYLSIRVHPSYKSKVSGNKRGNIKAIKNEYGLSKVYLDEDPLLKDDAICLRFEYSSRPRS